MNKKQIVKVQVECANTKYNQQNRYGICLNDRFVLLETGYIADVEKKLISCAPIELRQSSHEHQIKILPELWNRVDVLECSATRNVPQNIRAAMENAYAGIEKMLKLQTKFEQLQANYVDEMKKIYDTVKDFPEACRQERGVLTQKEFAEEFYKNLPDDLKWQMEHSAQHGYNGMDGNYQVKMWKNIQIERSVWFDKYAKPSYSFLEYDDTRMIISNPEKNADYMRDLKEYSKPLPVDGKKFNFEEHISIGDKNSLTYECMYLVKIDPKKELTKEYAKQLAEDFSGRKKEQIKDDDYER